MPAHSTSNRGGRRTGAGPKRKYQLNESAFADSSDPEAQYWAGFLMADGCVSRHLTTWSVSINLQTRDRGHLEKFRRFVGSTHPISEWGPNRPTVYDGRVIRGKGSVRIFFTSARMAADLARYGVVPRKSYFARATSLVADSADFWRGCVDGDGWVGIHRRATGREAASAGLIGTRELLSQFSAFVLRRSPRFTGGIHKNRNSDIAHTVRLDNAHAVGIVQALYGHGGPSLDRKQEAADRIIAAADRLSSGAFRAYEYRGKFYGMHELPSLSGHKYDVLRQRILHRGWSVAAAIETPVRKWTRGPS